jgi:multiple sugar transport system permease protein
MMKRNGTGWLFASPYLLYAVIFFAIPLIWSMYLSFTDWNLISPVYYFKGFDNFIEAVKHPGVQAAFFVTFKFMAAFVPMVIVSSLAVALVYMGCQSLKDYF